MMAVCFTCKINIRPVLMIGGEVVYVDTTSSAGDLVAYPKRDGSIVGGRRNNGPLPNGARRYHKHEHYSGPVVAPS